MNINDRMELIDLIHKVNFAEKAEAIDYTSYFFLTQRLKLAEMMLTQSLSPHTIFKDIRTTLGEYA